MYLFPYPYPDDKCSKYQSVEYLEISNLNGNSHHHHHHHQVVMITRCSLTLYRRPALSSITTGRSDMLHPVSVQGWCMKVLAGWPTLVHSSVNKPYDFIFASPTLHVLFILLGWFLRWEVSGRTAAVLWDATSKICSRQHVASLYSSHLAFSQCTSWAP